MLEHPVCHQLNKRMQIYYKNVLVGQQLHWGGNITRLDVFFLRYLELTNSEDEYLPQFG